MSTGKEVERDKGKTNFKTKQKEAHIGLLWQALL